MSFAILFIIKDEICGILCGRILSFVMSIFLFSFSAIKRWLNWAIKRWPIIKWWKLQLFYDTWTLLTVYASSLKISLAYNFPKVSFRYTMLVYSICLYAISESDRYVCGIWEWNVHSSYHRLNPYTSRMCVIMLWTQLHSIHFSYKYDRCAITNPNHLNEKKKMKEPEIVIGDFLSGIKIFNILPCINNFFFAISNKFILSSLIVILIMWPNVSHASWLLA